MKMFKYLAMSICTLYLAWIFMSWVDIVNNNMSDCVYQSWNFFNIMLEVF